MILHGIFFVAMATAPDMASDSDQMFIKQLREMRIITISDVDKVLYLLKSNRPPISEESRKIMSELLFDMLKGAVKAGIPPEEDLQELGQQIVYFNKQLEDSVRDVMLHFDWPPISIRKGTYKPVELAGEIIEKYPERKDEIVRMLLTQFLNFIRNNGNLFSYLSIKPDLDLYTKILKLGINSDQKKQIGRMFLSELKERKDLCLSEEIKLGRKIRQIDPNLWGEVVEYFRSRDPASPYFKNVLEKLMAAPATQETAGKQ